jgi:hypothetical protein
VPGGTARRHVGSFRYGMPLLTSQAIALSLPSPPMHTSLVAGGDGWIGGGGAPGGSSPASRSFPSRPLITSLWKPPGRRSLPSPPKMTSLPRPPMMSSAPSRRRRGSVPDASLRPSHYRGSTRTPSASPIARSGAVLPDVSAGDQRTRDGAGSSRHPGRGLGGHDVLRPVRNAAARRRTDRQDRHRCLRPAR